MKSSTFFKVLFIVLVKYFQFAQVRKILSWNFCSHYDPLFPPIKRLFGIETQRKKGKFFSFADIAL